MTKSRPLPTLLRAAVGAAALLLLAGCSTFTQKSADLDTAFRAGKFGEAVKEADALALKNADSKKDSIIYHLEQGAVLRAAALAADSGIAVAPAVETKKSKKKGDTDALPSTPVTPADLLRRSNAALDAAEARVNEWEEKARVKIGSEIGAAASNLANLPYRGRAYDKIMMNTYKALNHMQLGDLDAARVELNRVFQKQRQAVEENEKRIAENEAEIEKAKSGAETKGKGFDVERTARLLASPDAKAKLNTAALEKAAGDADPRTDYVNPFSVLLDGIFFSSCAMDNDDMEHARKSLERVVSMAPGNQFAKRDLADITAGAPLTGITYVIYENGSAPYREQEKFTLPISLMTAGPAPNVVVAFPYLKFNDTKPAPLAIGTGAGEIEPELVCNMDAVVARDFKNEWPAILTKTIISSGVKAVLDMAAQAGVKQATKDQGVGGQVMQGLFKLGSLVVQSAVTIADTRQWRTLPKEFYYARIPTPAGRVLTLRLPGQQQGAAVPADYKVELAPADVNVVYVKAIAPGVPLLVSQFKLKGRAAMPGYVPGPSLITEEQATAEAAKAAEAANPAFPAFREKMKNSKMQVEKGEAIRELLTTVGADPAPSKPRPAAADAVPTQGSEGIPAREDADQNGRAPDPAAADLAALAMARTPQEAVAAFQSLPPKQQRAAAPLFGERMKQLAMSRPDASDGGTASVPPTAPAPAAENAAPALPWLPHTTQRSRQTITRQDMAARQGDARFAFQIAREYERGKHIMKEWARPGLVSQPATCGTAKMPGSEGGLLEKP